MFVWFERNHANLMRAINWPQNWIILCIQRVQRKQNKEQWVDVTQWLQTTTNPRTKVMLVSFFFLQYVHTNTQMQLLLLLHRNSNWYSVYVCALVMISGCGFNHSLKYLVKAFKWVVAHPIFHFSDALKPSVARWI